VGLLLGYLRLWRHCLTHLGHRQESVTSQKTVIALYCHDCRATFYMASWLSNEELAAVARVQQLYREDSARCR